jgi:hypothetical protein
MKLTLDAAHRRILTGLLALSFMLVLLNFAPVASAERICETGCVNWNSHFGCLEYLTCCSYDDGSYSCQNT